MNQRNFQRGTAVRVKYWVLFVLLLIFSFSLHASQTSLAASPITVNSLLDVKNANDGFCTLREAVIAANQNKRSGTVSGECPAGSGTDTIILPAGQYLLTRTDNGMEDAAQTGDLDISGSLTINGDGAGVTVINGSGITDRLVHVLAGSVSINGVTLRQGHTSSNGGALFNRSNLILNDVALLDSQAGAAGGGLHMLGGTLNATAVTVAGNSSGSDGGGVAIAQGTATFVNSTISNNSTNGSGGGLSNKGNTTLSFVTIADNTAVQGASIRPIINTLTLNNTIISGSCMGTIVSQGYNLLQNPAGCIINGSTTGNILGQDPALDPLANNGGGTMTRALRQNSPAVEAGNNALCPATDQRGISRPRGVACDIGAFELENPPQTGPILFVNTTSDGDDGICDYSHCSLREAINLANVSSISNGISFNIPGSNPPTIFPQSALPIITAPIVIDGTTQSGGWVVLDGSQAGLVDGLVIVSGNSTVRGLRIINFGGHGILLSQSGGNLITGNEIANNGGDGIRITEGTGNQLSGNNIHDNGGLSIDLGGDGRTANDTDDTDTGANFAQNYPVLMSAIPETDGLHVMGRLDSTPNTTFTLEFYASATCDGGSQSFLGSFPASTDSDGNGYFNAVGLTAVALSQFIRATATDPLGNTSELSDCLSVSPGNIAWVTAMPLGVVPDLGPTAVDHYLDQPGQSRWYKFTVQPGSKLIVTLTNLPDNYDLTIYKDIAQAYTTLTTPQDLPRFDAEFAPEAFSPEAFSPEAFSPEAFSPEAFSPEAFSPEAFSPEAFSPEAFSPEAFSPEAFSPEAFSPDAFSPEAFSPEAFSPEAFSPEAFSPEAFSPEAFSGAQLRSLLGVSAFRGTANEGLIVNTWNNTGEYYVRVRGANGVFNTGSPFRISVEMQSGNCGDVAPILPPSSTTPTDGDYQTIILVDMARMVGTAVEKATLTSRLATFAARPEVAGLVVDVGADARVAAANMQADSYPACPYAKNQVTAAIKEIVNGYWSLNPLEFVVLVGNDGTIPFFRYPDNALLANENNYVPPVRDNTPSQASLRLGFVLGQDAYGARTELSFKNSAIPVPELAVGRLVETAVQATTQLDAYLTTTNGVTTLSTPPLVTGYDFLEDAALAVQAELEAGTGNSAETLITPNYLSPEANDSRVWTADDLRMSLLGSRHDIAFLAGHFSASGALAADYSTRMTAVELLQSPVNLQNAIIFSAGCHAGYNIVDADGVPLVTEEPDWAQAFGMKGALLIAGTGYQYGDTDFVEYSERLYLGFSQALRTGSGPVSVGQALVAAKQQYLAETPQMRGIHEKVLLESAIFGVPHLSVNMPGARLPASDEPSAVSTAVPVSTAPGSVLGLTTADLSLTPAFTGHTVEMTNVQDDTAVSAFYLSGTDGTVTNPAEPTLPLEMVNVGVSGTYLRGVGFRGGSYTDLGNILPFTGAPTTEIRGVHAPFQADIFFPVQFWRANYYDQLADPVNGSPFLAVTPAQFLSDSPNAQTGIMRRFDNLAFRLFYNNNITTFAGGSTPAFAAPPTISHVEAIPDDGVVHVAVDVVGNPAAGIQEVWVVYTAVTGPYFGQWQSLDLTQDSTYSTRWKGDLPLNGTSPSDMRYLVQAVNGVGLVSLATNVGDLYVPGATPPATSPTTLTLINPPTSGVYGAQVQVQAQLSSGEMPLSGQRVTIGLGPQSRQGMTDENGEVTVTLTLLGLPGVYPLQASFGGAGAFAASSTAVNFTISKQDTVLTLSQPAAGLPEDDALLTATLAGADGRRLGEKTIFFVITGTGGSFSQAVITDYSGRAVLGNLPLPPGEYTVQASFSGVITLHTGEIITLDDARYNPATVSGTLTLLESNSPPTCGTAVANPLTIWPPNGNFVLINITGVADPDEDAVSLTVTGIYQDEPVGNVPQAPDGGVLENGTPKVRAERDGNGDGRVYHIFFTANDGVGGSCSGFVRVAVVHDQGTDIDLIDGGPLYDSTQLD